MALTHPQATIEKENLTSRMPGARLEVVQSTETETYRYTDVTKIGGAVVRYSLETPADTTDDVPVVIIPGFCGIRSAYDQLAHALAERGKPAITVQPVRGRLFPASLIPRRPEPVDKLASQAVWGAMRDTKERHGYETFDVLAHSMGGLIATRLVEHQADSIRSVTYLASAGLDGDHSPRTMLARTLNGGAEDLLALVKSLKPVSDALASREVLHYVLRNPLRTVREALAVSTCNLTEDVQNVGYLGVKTAALQFAADRYFPLSLVEAHSGNAFKHFEVYGDTLAGHNAQQSDPEGVADAYLRLNRHLNGAA
jgi:pimeloyl-ACP methyl ester carboxylesterase